MPAEYDLSEDPHLRPGAPRSSAADNREVPARYCAGMNLQRISIVSFGLARVAVGVFAGSAPERLGRTWIGDDAAGEPTKVILRALGARDIALGAGTAAAATRDQAGPWLAVSVLADLGDVAATLLARENLPDRGVVTTSVVAGSAALAGLALLAVDSGPPEDEWS